MNIQTERLENHTARLTVSIDAERLERAKKEAARKLSQRLNIPGFRKGKVPYHIMLQFVGEGAIIEDALELLGNDVYKSALDESGVDPYGPGQLEDFTVDPQPTFRFVVPLQPSVALGDYRSIRLDFTVPTVTDEQVDRAIRQLRIQRAVIEESRKPVELGNRVIVEMYARLAEQPDEDERERKGEEGHTHDHGLGGNEFIHEHDAMLMLGEEDDEPAPGFRQALLGAAVDEERVFELTYPDDPEEYQDLAGKRAIFKVKIKKIETVTLPALNDEFAARLTEQEEKPLTLLELRVRIRENLQKQLEAEAKNAYAGRVLDELVSRATIAFPEALINDQTEDFLERFDRDLRRQKLTLDDYMRITGKTRDDLKADYRDNAVASVKRSLVLRQVMIDEKLQVDEGQVDAEIDRILTQFGEQKEQMRPAFDTPRMRESIRNDLLEQGVLERIVAIAKGEAPPLMDGTTSAPGEVTRQGESNS